MQKWEYLTVQVSSTHPTQSNAIPLPVMGLINGKEAIRNRPIRRVCEPAWPRRVGNDWNPCDLRIIWELSL